MSEDDRSIQEKGETLDQRPLIFSVNRGHEDLIPAGVVINESKRFEDYLEFDLASALIRPDSGGDISFQDRIVNLLNNQLGNDLAYLKGYEQLQQSFRGDLSKSEIQARLTTIIENVQTARTRLKQNANSGVEFVNRVWGSFFNKRVNLTLDAYYSEALNPIGVTDPISAPLEEIFPRAIRVIFTPAALIRPGKDDRPVLNKTGSMVQNFSQASVALRPRAV